MAAPRRYGEAGLPSAVEIDEKTPLKCRGTVNINKSSTHPGGVCGIIKLPEGRGIRPKPANSRKGGRIMNINIIGRQVTISDDMKEFVEKKLAKFDRYFPKGADAAVTFRKVRDNVCAEITITVGGTLFRGEEKSAEYKNALTRAIDVIEGQIRKNKTRLEKRMKTSFPGESSSGGTRTIFSRNSAVPPCLPPIPNPG